MLRLYGYSKSDITGCLSARLLRLRDKISIKITFFRTGLQQREPFQNSASCSFYRDYFLIVALLSAQQRKTGNQQQQAYVNLSPPTNGMAASSLKDLFKSNDNMIKVAQEANKKQRVQSSGGGSPYFETIAMKLLEQQRELRKNYTDTQLELLEVEVRTFACETAGCNQPSETIFRCASV
jgi:hypothetical protein